VNEWTKYRRGGLTEMRPYLEGEDLTGVSVGEDDRNNGSPKKGDMIARDPENPSDRWLVNARFFERQKFEPVSP